MPRVPEYNQRQIALDPANTPYQTMKPTAEAFGSDVGRALTDFGKSLGSVADSLGDAAKYLRQQDQEKNETAAVDLFNQFTAAQGKIADSYQTLSGKLAVDGYTATEKQLSILKRDYLSRAANPEQAELLSKAMEAGSATVLGQMQRYRDQQQGVYEDDVSTTRIGQVLANVRRFYNDDREYAKGVYLAQVESLDQLRRHQAGPAEIKARLTQVASTGMRQRIEGAMAQSDLGMARRLFDGHADGLLAPDREAIAAQLGHLEFNSRVENETTRILQASPLRLGGEQHGKTATEPGPPDAAGRLALAEKISDPELRLAVSDRIASQTIRDQQTYLTQQRQLKTQAKDIIDQGGSFTDLPYQMLIGIDAKGKAALSVYARAGGKVSTDFVTYYDLKNRALDDPQTFLDVDLYDHLGEIDAKDLATLEQLQQRLSSGTPDPQLDLERVYKGNIDRTLRGLDLSATDIANIHRQVDRDLAGYQAATGRKATPAEQQEIADQAVIDMKLNQRSFVMTRYGALISMTGNAANAKDNPLIIQTAGGDMRFFSGTDPQQAEVADATNVQDGRDSRVTQPLLNEKTDKPKGSIRRTEPADEKAYQAAAENVPFPNGTLNPSYTKEEKAIGPGKMQALELIKKLSPGLKSPLPGNLYLNRKHGNGTAAGPYGYVRTYQGGAPKLHNGYDFGAPVGTPVFAVKEGVVVFAQGNLLPGKKTGNPENDEYGNQVIIQHEDGTWTQYAHLNKSRNSDGTVKFLVQEGQRVKAGDQIGEVGKTGNVSGDSHLHFECRVLNSGRSKKNRTTINPGYCLSLEDVLRLQH
jgi:murein DD-endopeptidase MepM/ murein hydrolase activator NlpD